MRTGFICGVLVLLLPLSGCADPDQAVQAIPHGLPVYPAAALKEGRTGSVALECSVTAAGTVDSCRVQRASSPAFAASALAFAQQGRYVPATRNGVAVDTPHHRLLLRFVLPPQVFTISTICAVSATGSVRNCQAPATRKALWSGLSTVLERMQANPLYRDGQPVDDPGRPVTVTVAIAPLPLFKPMPDVSGDMVRSFVLNCHPQPGGPDRCVAEHPTQPEQEADRPDDAIRLRMDVGITGISPPPTGDFSQ